MERVIVARTSTLLKRLQPPHRSERPDPKVDARSAVMTVLASRRMPPDGAGHEPLAIVLGSELNRVIETSVVSDDTSRGG